MQAIGDFYNYEKRFAEIWVELGHAVLESSIGEIPKDRRKKKSRPGSEGLKLPTGTRSAYR